MGIDDVLALLAAVSGHVKDIETTSSDNPQFLFVLGLVVPIIIRKRDQSHFLHTRRRGLTIILSEEAADANLGNHIQKTPDGKPMPTSPLFNLVSNFESLTCDKG